MGAAKLVNPPLDCVAAAKPPLRAVPAKPDPAPSFPNPDVPVEANGEAADVSEDVPANPVASGFFDSVVVAEPKAEGVEPARLLNGDFSEPANAARLDEAKADDEVASAGFSLAPGDLDDARDANGDTAEEFENALVEGICKNMYT